MGWCQLMLWSETVSLNLRITPLQAILLLNLHLSSWLDRVNEGNGWRFIGRYQSQGMRGIP